jgi:hypothetical protein
LNQEPTERYILLPARSLTGASSLVGSKTRNFLSCCATSFSSRRRIDWTSPAEAIDALPLGSVEVIDSISPGGAKLVDLTIEGLKEIKTLQPGLQVIPLQYYSLALQPRIQLKAPTRHQAHRTGESTRLRVLNAQTGLPITHAQVLAVLDSATLEGVYGTSNALGEVSLPVLPATPIARLHVYPRSGYWTLVQHDLVLPAELHLVPIEPGFRDGLRHFYPEAKLTDGAGVKVGVLDTGIAEHPDLVVAGGCNVVPFEDPHDWQDNGEGHGTHIAGIIAARGPSLRGLAPGVELRSYRICATGSAWAAAGPWPKAILRASQDGCDILNLSLGGGPHDPTVQTAIRDARQLAMPFHKSSEAPGSSSSTSTSEVISDPNLLRVLDLLQEAQQNAKESLEEARRYERQSIALQYELHSYRRALNENAQTLVEKQTIADQAEHLAERTRELDWRSKTRLSSSNLKPRRMSSVNA